MNAYLAVMEQASKAGFYVPEIELCYSKYDDFRYPAVFTYQPH